MNPEIVLDLPEATVWYHPDGNIIHHKIKKFIYGEKFQKVLMTGLEAFIQHGCTKWLSDDASNTTQRQEDLDWGNENWTPKVIDAGWKYWALVMPVKVLGQINMKPLINQYKGMGVTVELFDDAEKALAWLKEQN